MKNNHWADIQALFRMKDELFSPFEGGARDEDAVRPSSLADSSMGRGLEEGAGSVRSDLSEPTLEELVQVRAKMRDALDILREALARDLTERDVYFILFPIVAHLDEEVQTRYVEPIRLGGWPPLQRELFDTDAAGELFYETLEDILLKPQTLPLILEVYYFCLHDGFQGRLVSNPSRRQEYMERLRGRIPQPDMDVDASPMPLPDHRSPSFMDSVSPLWFYGGAMLAVALFFLLLKAIGPSWNPIL